MTSRLGASGLLSAWDRPHVLVKPVTVRLRSSAYLWNLVKNTSELENTREDLPGALVTKASGHVIIVIYPSANSRELLRVNGAEADVLESGKVIGELRADGYRAVVPTRVAPKLSRQWGFPETASYRGEPMIAWRGGGGSTNSGRLILSDYIGDVVDTSDGVVVELCNGSCVVVHNNVILSEAPRPGMLRDIVVTMPPSARRDFIRTYWRTLQTQLADHPVVEMKQGRVTSATLNGDRDLAALVGPVRRGRSWVIVINPRSRMAILPDPTLKYYYGAPGEKVPIREAELEDGRKLRPERYGWSVSAEAGGEPAPAISRPWPSRGPGGVVRPKRVLEPAD